MDTSHKEHNHGTEHKDAQHPEHNHDHDDHPHAEHRHDDHNQAQHGHDHSEHDHDHEHTTGIWATLLHLLPFSHSHDHSGIGANDAMETNARGIWAVKVSLAGLALTAGIQLAVVLLSGSVGLLADTIHNFADAATAIPLWIAFQLGRRPPSRRYTYGYGRAEDVAGVVIIAIMLISGLIVIWESVDRFIHPQPVTNLAWVAFAAIIGFVGNEAVAMFRIRIGQEIESAALVADGQHARADGLTSLAVLFGVAGVWLGFPLADPIIGLLISIAILFIIRDAAKAVWARVMDAVDPALVETIEHTAAKVDGVNNVHDVRLRWSGHKLYAELHIGVIESLTVAESHTIIDEVQHQLGHALPGLTHVSVHPDPVQAAVLAPEYIPVS